MLPWRTIRPLPIASCSGVSGSATPVPVAARITEGDRALSCSAAVWVMWTSSASSAGGHDHEIGQGREISDVEAAGMGRAVGADQPGAVDREAHRQVLDRDVVDDLVVGALQEGRIDRAERAHALRGEAGGESDRVLLGDADVERALRMRLGELVDAGAATAWPR